MRIRMIWLTAMIASVVLASPCVRAQGTLRPSNAQHIARVLDRALQVVLKTDDTAFRSQALAEIAVRQSLAGLQQSAHRTAAMILAGSNRSYALGFIAGKDTPKSAEATIRQALESLPPLQDEEARREAYVALVLGQANSGDFPRARKSADGVPDAQTRVECLLALCEVEAANEQPPRLEMLRDAANAVGEIKDPKIRDRMLARIAAFQAYSGDAKSAIGTASSVKGPESKPDAMYATAAAQAVEGDLESARKTADSIQQTRLKDQALQFIAIAQMRSGSGSAARATLDAIQSEEQKVAALLVIARYQAMVGKREDSVADYERAIKIARSIADPKARSAALGRVALDQTQSGRLAEAQRTLAEVSSFEGRDMLIAMLAAARTRAGEGKAVLAWADARAASRDQVCALIGYASGLIDMQAKSLGERRAKSLANVVPPQFAPGGTTAWSYSTRKPGS